MESLYRSHRFPAEIISHAVRLYDLVALSSREVEDPLAKRGAAASYGTISLWRRKFGPILARNLRRRQGRQRDGWHVDEGLATIRGRRRYLWRAVEQDGDVLDLPVTCPAGMPEPPSAFSASS